MDDLEAIGFLILLFIIPGFLIYGVIFAIKNHYDNSGKKYIKKSKDYAESNHLTFYEDKTNFITEELPFEKLEIQKFFNVVEGSKEDLNYWFGLYETKPDENNATQSKSLFIIKNKHLGLPRFYVKRSGAYLARYKVNLGNEKRFVVIGRPAKLVELVFTPQVNEAISRIFNSFKGIELIEAVGEYIYIQGLPSFSIEDFTKINDILLSFSSILALNEEFNVDHIN